MERKAAATRRVEGDRVNYLEETSYGHTSDHITLVREGTRASVLTWTSLQYSVGTVTLCLRGKSTFSYQENILPADARLLAQALLMAADDAEQAIEATAIRDEVAA